MAHTPRNESEKATLAARRAWCYLVLVFFSFLCLFFFYILVINSTRTPVSYTHLTLPTTERV